MEQKSNCREFVHTKELLGDKRANEQLTLAKIRELTVYNSHVTCCNSSLSLTMVTSTSHFFAFHWLCCLLPIGYLLKTGSVGVRICCYHRIQPRPQVKVIFRYLRLDAPVFNIHHIHNNCGHGDISAITLLISSLSGCSSLNIL